MVKRAGCLVAGVVLITLAACKPEGPPVLSLEEAKSATASFKGQSFTPPPKTIVDIEKLLDSQSPVDPEAVREERALASAEPPADASAETLALFYYRRGQVADRLGRVKQALADFREADARSDAVTDLRSRRFIGQDRSRIEYEVGDVMAGLRIRHALAERYPRPENRLSDYGVLSMDYANSGNLKEAEKYLKLAQAAFDQLHARRSWSRLGDIFTRNINSFRSDFLRVTGELEEAERTARIAAEKNREIRDNRSNPRFDRQYGQNLNDLAAVLLRRGKLLEAEVVVRDAIRDSLQQQGRYSRRTASHLHRFASVLQAQGRSSDAERIVRYVLDAYRKMGIDDGALQVLQARRSLAQAYAGQGRWGDAAAEFASIERTTNELSSFVQRSIGSSPEYPFALARIGQFENARAIAEELLARLLRTAGDKAVKTAQVRGALAVALVGIGENEKASAAFSKAIPILLQRSRRTDDGTSSQSFDRTMTRLLLESYIDLLTRFSGVDSGSNSDKVRIQVAYRLAQGASARSVQGALSASAARAAVRDPDLADLVRKEQDALARIGALNGLLANTLNLSSENRDANAIRDVRTRIDRLRGARAALAEEIERRFPDYASLMNPKPVTISNAQKIMRSGEALIATYVGENSTYIWAVPKIGEPAFAAVRFGKERIAAVVRDLRRSLDPRAATLGDIPAFDVALSHRLYNALLRPVEAGWKGAQSLLIVAHGALGQFPFSALVAGDADIGPELKPLFSNYREIPFLVRSHAVTVLPSVSALATLRSLPPASPTRRNFVGFGDPLFAATQSAAAPPIEPATAFANRGAIAVRGLPVKLRAAPNLDGVSSANLENLPRLPDTADEVRGIAIEMNADLTRDVFTGKSASEGRVKSMTLSGYKVLAFATHGLVPGELNGLTEPALAMSSPKVTGGQDDGLLTMGEILGLKLDADWVVLSACNTASGNGAGAEAVSGLGRAFFYAGTRALLVSNWPVETTSARVLTTDMFGRQARDASLSRAQALRQAMLGLIDGPGFKDGEGKVVFSYAHPIFWAPFSLVGDGGGGTPAG